MTSGRKITKRIERTFAACESFVSILRIAKNYTNNRKWEWAMGQNGRNFC